MKFEATCYNIWSSSITVGEFIVDIPNKTFWRKSNNDYGLTTYVGIFKRTRKSLCDLISPDFHRSHDFIYLTCFDDIGIITIQSADTIPAVERAIENQRDSLKDSILNHYYINICQRLSGEYYVGGLVKIDEILFKSYSAAVAIDLEDKQQSIHRTTQELYHIMGRSANAAESNWYRIDDDRAEAVWKDAQMHVLSQLGCGQYESKIQWGINLGDQFISNIKSFIMYKYEALIEPQESSNKQTSHKSISQDINNGVNEIKQFESQFFKKKPEALY